MAGLLVLVQFNVPILPVTLAIAFLLGFPNPASNAAAITLLQRRVPDTYLGRVLGALGATTTLVSLVSVVGLAGVLGEIIGIVPMLNVAAGVILVAGVHALVVLPHSMPDGELAQPRGQTPAMRE